MGIQRVLRMLASVLFAAAVITGLCCPPGFLPSITGVILAVATAVVLLASMLIGLVKNRRSGGWVNVFIGFALILTIVGGVGSYFLSSDSLVELSPGDGLVLNEDGYVLEFIDCNGKDLNHATFDVVLTRPDMVSFHETISQTMPFEIDGVNIHPMEVYEDGAVFLIEQDIFIKVMGVGGILLLVGLALLALPIAKRKGVQ